jgi:hypothetical protein
MIDRFEADVRALVEMDSRLTEGERECAGKAGGSTA